MNATARQRVRTTLAHRQPDRVPFSWQFCATPEMSRCMECELASRGLSWKALREVTEDIVPLSPNYCGPDAYGGGYIAAPSHAIQLGTPVDSVLAMLNGVLGDDDYAAALERSAFNVGTI